MPPFAASDLPAPIPTSASWGATAGWGATETDGSGSLSPRRVLEAIRYWWAWALPAGIVFAAVAGGLVLATFHPSYMASAWLRIEDRAPFIAFESKEGDQSKSFVQTQLELLRSPMVLEPALAKAELARLDCLAEQDDPVSWLALQIKVKAVGTSELYTVSLTCPEAKAAADVVNAVVDSYFRLREEEEAGRRKNVTEVLRLELQRRTEALKRLRESVRELAKLATGKDPFGPTENVARQPSQSLGDLSNRIVAAEVEESVLAAKLKVLEAIDLKRRADLPQSTIDRAVAENPRTQKAAVALAEKKAALAELEAKLTKGKEDPRYQRAEEAVRQEEKALEQLKAALLKQTKEQLEATLYGKREEELAAMRVDLESRRVIKDLLKERYQSELKNVQQLSGDTISFKFKQDELAREEKVVELISERVLKLDTEQGAPARVAEMKRAEVPSAPEQRLPYRNMILALLGGFCLPFGLAVLKEQLARRITDSQCVEQQAHLAVIGEIARLPSQGTSSRRRRARQRRATLLFEESMDAVRTHLFLSAKSETRVLALTSAINHEGKTSVAVQLAVSLARAGGEPTLIIDGDMRSPDVHRVLQVPLEPGLSKVLAGDCQVRDAIVKLNDRIHVLPAGKLHANPHTLVGNGAMDSLLGSIPPEYRYVILDTPPVLAASEALVFARAADAVLMCVMRDVSRVSQVTKAADKVTTVGGRLVGTVLSGVPTRHYVTRYGSYRYPDDSTGESL